MDFGINATYIGLLGGTLTNLSLLPQITKAVRTKSVNDISIAMFWVLFAGIFCWFVYGLLLGNSVIIAMNSCSLVLVGTMIYLYYHYYDKSFPPSTK